MDRTNLIHANLYWSILISEDPKNKGIAKMEVKRHPWYQGQPTTGIFKNRETARKALRKIKDALRGVGL